MKKQGRLVYQKCEISYSVYGEKKKYSAKAWVTVDDKDSTTQQEIFLEKTYKTLESAENSIIEGCKQWVNDNC